METKKQSCQKVICYICGLLVMSLGSNLFLKAALGVAPSCTIALALTKMFPSMGYAVFNFIVNGCLLICEIAVEKKIGKKQAVQLLLTFVYSLFIQWTSALFHSFNAELMSTRIVMSFAACAVLAAGIFLTVQSGLAVLPMEGFVSSLAKKRGLPFGTVRVQVEVLITAGSAVMSVLLIHDLSVVGIGTVIAAFCTGMMNNCFVWIFTHMRQMKHMRRPRSRFA
ncbi:MAG TPA: hypothetical protein H9743_01705 [Candidatus Mediterraneibacter vanvlietii]|nr:hypothetical protein [Candidatus Mediterraneibacter vanvlietii]